jgi:hypothetical protein
MKNLSTTEHTENAEAGWPAHVGSPEESSAGSVLSVVESVRDSVGNLRGDVSV